MNFMENSEFIARALRDYLRPFVDEAELHDMDRSLFVGEPAVSIFDGVCVAVEFGIALPPLFREKIIELGPLAMRLSDFILEEFDKLPAYWQKAS